MLKEGHERLSRSDGRIQRRRPSRHRQQRPSTVPFVGARDLIEIKKTNREKDYPVIGELARLIEDPAEQLAVSRSARDIRALARSFPEEAARIAQQRPLLELAGAAPGRLEAALDAERRELMLANERRLEAYAAAAGNWRKGWPDLAERIRGLSLAEAHEVMVEHACDVLPFVPDARP